jgi:hypothetical protein
MIKKNVEFKWGSKEKEAFEKIKEDIVQAPALLSLDFDRDFILYTFSFDIAFVVCLNTEEFRRRRVSCGFYEFRSTRS